MKIVQHILSNFIKEGITADNFLKNIDENKQYSSTLGILSNDVKDYLSTRNDFEIDEVFNSIIKDISKLNRRADKLSVLCYIIDYLMSDDEEDRFFNEWRKVALSFRKDIEYIAATE